MVPLAESLVLSTASWSRIVGEKYGFSSLYDFAAVFSTKVGNRITTVPKTALIDRCIAVEPNLNQYMQLGIGSVIRARLLSEGLDIRTLQERHRKLCRSASVKGDLATVDLRGASDSIALELVRELLPDDWFALMDRARSHHFIVNGSVHYSEKFSSMGNVYVRVRDIDFLCLDSGYLQVFKFTTVRECLWRRHYLSVWLLQLPSASF